MTTSTKFLCIDDQSDSTIDPLLQKLADTGLVSFTRWTPTPLEGQLPAIEKYVAEQDGDYGLLLDLRLDVDVDANGNRVAYRGPTLAQELRTRMAEGGIPAFPIVLWSVNTKFKISYFGDESSHDLFDDVYGKDSDIVDRPAEVATQLSSLAEGYSVLRKLKKENALAILDLHAEQESAVYSHFIDEYLGIARYQSPHEVAYFILNELVRAPGLLVSEALLAARLGVDISTSGSSWVELLARLESTRYQGPFNHGWPRWWWFRVEDWWAALAEDIPDLRSLDSAERITHLNNIFGLSLVAPAPIAIGYSTKYFSICAGHKKPLDPIDGLSVVVKSSRSWHDNAFVSVDAALERVGRANWHLDPLERDRLASIKEERGK